MANIWSKKEEEILKENFPIGKWEDLLSILGNKTEKQILSKASKLGLKREPEKIEEYYDKEKGAWVESYISYDKKKIQLNNIYPVKKGTTLKEVKDSISKRGSSFIVEKVLKPKYIEFLKTVGVEFNTPEIQKLYYEMQSKMFFISDENENEKDKTWREFEGKLIKEVERREFEEKLFKEVEKFIEKKRKQ